jgi:hypothetical protein
MKKVKNLFYDRLEAVLEDTKGIITFGAGEVKDVDDVDADWILNRYPKELAEIPFNYDEEMKPKKVYLCEICGKEFDHNLKLVAHKKSEHKALDKKEK